MCPFVAPTDYEIGTIEAQERQKMNAARFSEKIRKFGDGGYLNIDYLPSQDWKVDFWGEHYVDLLKVKIKYDPDNLFYCNHCVGSDMKFGDQLESSGVSTSVTGHVPAVLLLVLAIFMNYM